MPQTGSTGTLLKHGRSVFNYTDSPSKKKLTDQSVIFIRQVQDLLLIGE
jgi:hypothetical protein